MKSITETTMQDKYLAYCQEHERTPMVEFISERVFRVPYGFKQVGEVTALMFWKKVPQGFKRAHKIYNSSVTYATFDGFLYFEINKKTETVAETI